MKTESGRAGRPTKPILLAIHSYGGITLSPEEVKKIVEGPLALAHNLAADIPQEPVIEADWV